MEKFETTEILGITFQVIGDMLLTKDAGLRIGGTSESEQSFAFKSCMLDVDFSKLFVKYTPPELFDKYNCTRVGIAGAGEDDLIDLDRIRYPEKITDFRIGCHESTKLVFSKNLSYFKNLKSVGFGMARPQNFPDCRDVKTITHIHTDGGVDRLGEWFDLSVVKSIFIDDFSKSDLTSLKDFKSLELLRLWNRPKMRSLDGLENLPNLRILDIAYPTKLTDISAIMRTNNLRNIQFHKFKKIQNWDFLADKKDIEALVIDTAESTEFVKQLPNLKYFFCEKAIDKNSKPVYYVPETMADITPQSAFKDGWPHTKAFD